MKNFLLQAFTCFLLYKYGWRIYYFIVGKLRQRRVPLPPSPSTMTQSKPIQATAVNSSSEQDAIASVESAQNSEGAAFTGTMAAARTSMTTSSVAVTTARTKESQAYSRLMNVVDQCMGQYSELGPWLSDQIYGYMEAVDIPAMYKKFMALSPVERAVIVIAVLGLVGLLGWMAWEGVAYVWPHLMNFLGSPEGQEFLETATGFLKQLAESEVMKKFVGIFSTSSNPSGDEDPPCFDMTNWTMLTSMVVVPMAEIVKCFFAYLTKNALTK